MTYKYLTLIVATVFLLISNSTYSSETKNQTWTQNQTNKLYMRTITKDQCMLKAIDSLKDCETDSSCIEWVSVITNMCITHASGDIKKLCNNYKIKYIDKYCAPDYLDERHCKVLHIQNILSCP